jgi:hypothetical protein
VGDFIRGRFPSWAIHSWAIPSWAISFVGDVLRGRFPSWAISFVGDLLESRNQSATRKRTQDREETQTDLAEIPQKISADKIFP